MSRLLPILLLVLAGCSAPPPPTPPAPAPVAPLESYALPDDVAFPEGIAYDAANGVVYTASALNGTIARLNVATRASDIVATDVLFRKGESPRFPSVLGMKLDAQGQLWLAGGNTGRMFVVDTTKGTVVRQFRVPKPEDSLINDVALVGGAAYFTDTRAPILWRVQTTNNKIGNLEPWLNFTKTPLQYDPKANNINGIAATADGTSLIVVQMGAGRLFRIDIKTKAVTPIDTGGQALSGADGLVLDGRTLYVVRQTEAEICRVDLSDDLSKGTVSARLKDPLLAWPATASKVGDRLIVVNTQFNKRTGKNETRPFTLVSVPLARLAPAR
jgi:sugar lactone lactonase YvrE